MAYDRPNYTGSYSAGSSELTPQQKRALAELENRSADGGFYGNPNGYRDARNQILGNTTPDFSTTEFGTESEGEYKVEFGKLPKGVQDMLKGVEGANTLEKMRNAGLDDGDIAMLDAATKLRKKGDPKNAEERAAMDARTQQLLTEIDPAAFTDLAKQVKLSPEKVAEQMMADLAKYGISSVGQIGTREVGGEQFYYNKESGELIPKNFGSDMSGHGGRWFELNTNDQGVAFPTPRWKDTNQNTEIMMGLAALTMGYAAYAGAAAGASGAGAAGASGSGGAAAAGSGAAAGSTGLTGAQVGAAMVKGGLTNAAVQGGMTLAQGGDLGDALKAGGKGFVTGAVSGGAGAYAGTISTGSQIGNAIVRGGIQGAAASGAGALVNGGGNVLQEAGRGFVTGGLSAGAGSLVAGATGSAAAGRVAQRTVGGAVSNAQTGKDAGLGARRGLVQGGLEATGVPGYLAGPAAGILTRQEQDGLPPTQQVEEAQGASTSARIGRGFGVAPQLDARTRG